MNKSTAKSLKLKLHRETLRALEEPELAAALGAATNMRSVCGSCATCVVIRTMCFP
ncbi:MAG TPA: hypothetical protein VF173_03205 [Thermoanaerobaculia bacterium]|nr:hypothetical protein [Thermoanaerobaculia bacterium]